jgi:hypothetical protein
MKEKGGVRETLPRYGVDKRQIQRRRTAILLIRERDAVQVVILCVGASVVARRNGRGRRRAHFRATLLGQRNVLNVAVLHSRVPVIRGALFFFAVHACAILGHRLCVGGSRRRWRPWRCGSSLCSRRRWRSSWL